MRRVVSLLHRQAVKAKAEGLFFKVSTARLFDLGRFLFPSDSASASFTYALGVDLGPFQDDPGRSEGSPTRAAIQGPHKSY